MTGHPEPGALRAWLDGERPDLAPHLAGCTACRERSAGQASAARLAATALADPPDLHLDVEAALAAARPAPAAVIPLRRPARQAAWLGRAAAAVVLVAVVGGIVATPGGRASAAALLERFRAEQVVAVPVDFAAVDPAALASLVEVADVEGLEDATVPREVADLGEAAAVTGITATPLDPATLPEGVTGPVRVMAYAPQVVRVDFTDEVPAGIRDATLVVQVPGAVVQVVEVGGGEDAPAALRGEAGSLEVTVEGGPTLAQVRDALLSQPGLPPDTVAALRGIEDWETTLPLPVPAGQIAWQETTVGGRPALAFGDETGLGSALLWRDGDRFVGVGGMLSLSDARRLAEAG